MEANFEHLVEQAAARIGRSPEETFATATTLAPQLGRTVHEQLEAIIRYGTGSQEPRFLTTVRQRAAKAGITVQQLLAQDTQALRDVPPEVDAMSVEEILGLPQ